MVCVTINSWRPDAGAPGPTREARACWRCKSVFMCGPIRCFGSPLVSKWAVQVAHVPPTSRG